MDTSPVLLTIGYENLGIDQFVDTLRRHEVDTVVDVRLRASSRKTGYSKKALASALAAVCIAYLHERDLGNPPTNRASFRSGRVQEGRAVMRARLEGGSAETLERLVERARQERVALLCVESTDERCHRQVIIEMAREIQPELKVASIC